MLNPEEARRLWASELKSGRWQQGENYLYRDDRYCCLGVACELAIRDGVDLRVEQRTVEDSDDVDANVKAYIDPKTLYDEIQWLPGPVRVWLGLSSPTGDLESKILYMGLELDDLSQLNDNGMTFSEIATLIEEGRVRVTA